MGEFIMFLGIVVLGGITINPILAMIISPVLLIVGGNICVGGKG